ncbi:hypothetical protein [Salibacterium aidingense]|uniref:hypothetical protein n=1 Tax=Salibacterium aidingense TaxID=384933 RepID=UPI003BCB36BA
MTKRKAPGITAIILAAEHEGERYENAHMAIVYENETAVEKIAKLQAKGYRIFHTFPYADTEDDYLPQNDRRASEGLT